MVTIMPGNLFSIVFILLFFNVFISVCHAAQTKEYTLAVVPQYPKLTIHKNWTPLIKYLSRKTNISLTLKHYKSITEFGNELSKGVPDFAYMNPFQAVQAKRDQGYIPLVRDGVKKLKGILVVRQDSPVKTIEDIDGQVVSFPDPNAFAASLYLRALLYEKNINVQPEYVVTHANVYRHVVLKKTIAGGGVYRTLNNESAPFRQQLRVIFETPGSSPHPIGVHPRVPAEVQKSISEAFIELGLDEKYKGLLKPVQIPRPVKANYEKDYQPLENLQLDKYMSAEGG